MHEPIFDARLQLVREPSGLRHVLAGRPVHAGDALELQFAGGAWVRGRYEWNFQGEQPPFFYLGLAGSNDLVMVRLPSSAVLRWPTI